MSKEKFESNHPKALPIAIGSLLLFTIGCSSESLLVLAPPVVFWTANLIIGSSLFSTVINTGLYYFGKEIQD